ncbi:hypothetical protein BDV35DRAFT_385389 [Aspergillus flavus]|uniref:Uncharacterized protein n=1 Tax=Aspergillus flavus TaxID=5059 RepID=A0A5N6GII8_ASPFL|nr:hypothetical protein BDV35DRAFT_385389 [Aspergillus flavus]
MAAKKGKWDRAGFPVGIPWRSAQGSRLATARRGPVEKTAGDCEIAYPRSWFLMEE